MLVEKFDYEDFFDPEKKYLKNPEAKYYGVGAVSVITPKQSITRWNAPLISEEGIMELGLGNHPSNLRNIVREILGKKNNVLSSELENDETNFLAESIFIFYSNGDISNIVIHVPDRITSEQLKCLEDINEKIKTLKVDIDVIVDSKYVRGNFSETSSLDKTIEVSKKSLDDNYVFPFDENIIVEENNYNVRM